MCGIAFFAVTAVHIPRRDRSANRAWTLGLGLFLAGLVLYTLWRVWTFGSLMPNVFYAKMGGDLIPRLIQGLAHLGSLILLTAGLPIGIPGNTNMLKVLTIT